MAFTGDDTGDPINWYQEPRLPMMRSFPNPSPSVPVGELQPLTMGVAAPTTAQLQHQTHHSSFESLLAAKFETLQQTLLACLNHTTNPPSFSYTHPYPPSPSANCNYLPPFLPPNYNHDIILPTSASSTDSLSMSIPIIPTYEYSTSTTVPNFQIAEPTPHPQSSCPIRSHTTPQSPWQSCQEHSTLYSSSAPQFGSCTLDLHLDTVQATPLPSLQSLPSACYYPNYAGDEHFTSSIPESEVTVHYDCDMAVEHCFQLTEQKGSALLTDNLEVLSFMEKVCTEDDDKLQHVQVVGLEATTLTHAIENDNDIYPFSIQSPIEEDFKCWSSRELEKMANDVELFQSGDTISARKFSVCCNDVGKFNFICTNGCSAIGVTNHEEYENSNAFGECKTIPLSDTQWPHVGQFHPAPEPPPSMGHTSTGVDEDVQCAQVTVNQNIEADTTIIILQPHIHTSSQFGDHATNLSYPKKLRLRLKTKQQWSMKTKRKLQLLRNRQQLNSKTAMSTCQVRGRRRKDPCSLPKFHQLLSLFRLPRYYHDFFAKLEMVVSKQYKYGYVSSLLNDDLGLFMAELFLYGEFKLSTECIETKKALLDGNIGLAQFSTRNSLKKTKLKSELMPDKIFETWKSIVGVDILLERLRDKELKMELFSKTLDSMGNTNECPVDFTNHGYTVLHDDCDCNVYLWVLNLREVMEPLVSPHSSFYFNTVSVWYSGTISLSGEIVQAFQVHNIPIHQTACYFHLVDHLVCIVWSPFDFSLAISVHCEYLVQNIMENAENKSTEELLPNSQSTLPQSKTTKWLHLAPFSVTDWTSSFQQESICSWTRKHIDITLLTKFPSKIELQLLCQWDKHFGFLRTIVELSSRIASFGKCMEWDDILRTSGQTAERTPVIAMDIYVTRLEQWSDMIQKNLYRVNDFGVSVSFYLVDSAFIRGANSTSPRFDASIVTDSQLTNIPTVKLRDLCDEVRLVAWLLNERAHSVLLIVFLAERYIFIEGLRADEFSDQILNGATGLGVLHEFFKKTLFVHNFGQRLGCGMQHKENIDPLTINAASVDPDYVLKFSALPVLQVATEYKASSELVKGFMEFSTPVGDNLREEVFYSCMVANSWTTKKNPHRHNCLKFLLFEEPRVLKSSIGKMLTDDSFVVWPFIGEGPKLPGEEIVLTAALHTIEPLITMKTHLFDFDGVNTVRRGHKMIDYEITWQSNFKIVIFYFGHGCFWLNTMKSDFYGSLTFGMLISDDIYCSSLYTA